MLGSTPDKPIRCSKLNDIAKCTMRLYLMSELMEDVETEGGQAAQTGSLTHEGVAAFHKTQDKPIEERKRAAWEAINAARTNFPLAEENDVRLFITPYMNDPRNIHANCIAVERTIHFTLPPHELDNSRQPIYVQGTLDQLRLINDEAYVYDLKTGKRTGWEMIHDYALQMAAYTYAVRLQSDPIWKQAKPGKIIRNHGYRTRSALGDSPDGVFWDLPFTEHSLEDLLDGVRLNIALYRNGHISYGPGAWCSYCEFKGLMTCTHAYKQVEAQQLPIQTLQIREY